MAPDTEPVGMPCKLSQEAAQAIPADRGMAGTLGQCAVRSAPGAKGRPSPHPRRSKMLWKKGFSHGPAWAPLACSLGS